MNNNTNKKKEQRQGVFVTVVVIAMMVGIVVAVATSLARNDPTDPANWDTTENADAISDNEKVLSGKNDLSDILDTEDVFLGNDKKDEKDEDTKAPEKDKSTESTEKTDTQKDNAATLPQFMSPVSGEIIKDYSMSVPVFSQTMEDYRTHSGVDLYCAAGCDIAAAAEGTVKEIWDDPMMGMSISIEHSGGAVSVYQNLYDEIPAGIEVGSRVQKGQVIATAGDTALSEISEDSHLHFELSVNGEIVDPCDYIEFSKGISEN